MSTISSVGNNYYGTVTAAQNYSTTASPADNNGANKDSKVTISQQAKQAAVAAQQALEDFKTQGGNPNSFGNAMNALNTLSNTLNAAQNNNTANTTNAATNTTKNAAQNNNTANTTNAATNTTKATTNATTNTTQNVWNSVLKSLNSKTA